ncbi:TetR/AcrR family transcriptional regulator [Desulfohalovibrio reitneri]|uniref:TetR/AcrR family transcriptional regulator n=1 Tax=Desulfohalovibrio reitneri TaxID=1307759 RepID=UPI00068E9664|nr:TetR/AcrR family transcriptional regulator [Desulfohalovibrio reitneri]
MKTTKRRMRDRERMRRKILDAALALFAKGGMKALSMRGIATRIEYSPGTIYRYFEDKSAIVRELCLQGFELFYESVMAPVDRGEFDGMGWEARWHLQGEAYLRFARQYPDYYHLMFNTPGVPWIEDPELPPMRAFNRLVEDVERSMAEGGLPRSDARTTAISMWSGLHGLASLRMNDNLRMVEPDEVPDLVRGVIDYLIGVEA